MTFNFEKYRIILTRIAAAVILFFFLTTRSRWETVNEGLTFLLFLVGMVLVAVASLGRMWCSLYIAGYKDSRLITQGPYSLCRNPLYFFSLIGAAGLGFATETLTFPIIFILLFAAYYGFVIKSEEARLKKLFGAEFESYAKKVPAFFPKLSTFVEPEDYSVKPAVYRRHIFSALWFIWIVGILEVVEGLKDLGFLPSFWSVY